MNIERVERSGANDAAASARPSIWKLGGLGWRELGGRVWEEVWNGHLFVHAAALAFYFLFALFPLLIFLVNLLGFFAGRGSEMRSDLLSYIRQVVPASAFQLIAELLDEIATGAHGLKLLFGLIAALWFGSLGIAALSETLNSMYGVRESRAWWRVRGSAVGLTVVLLALTFTALSLVVYGRQLGADAADWIGLGETFATVWALLRMPLAVAFVLLAFAMVYYFGPDHKDQKWYWITPGSIAGVAVWLAASAMLSTYLRYADTYSITYGSLGGVVVLMLWFYITGASILLGGKINAEIENAAAKAGIPTAKRRGEREPGDKD